MGLSRLSNFLKNVKGNIIYVDPNSLDSTDNIENQGNSLTRPFKTVQRALIEAARFSYQRGKRNDRFLKTTILLYPGDHYIDNRPGWIPTGQDQFTLRNGIEGFNSIFELDYQSNFDILDSANDLYKMNSVYGGVIIPRGTSIVGMDLRKTKIRPLFIPDPQEADIGRSAIFRVTGGCYFWQFTILDGDPNGLVFSDYTGNQRVPNYSHHKLTVFEYADGINPVKINDDFLTYSTDRTDLEIYYEKIGLAYGSGSGRSISPDYPSISTDIDPVVDEYRVVGSRGLEVGITTIRSGNGIVGSPEITVFLDQSVEQLSVDTPIQITGISEPGYDGQYAVYEVIDDKSFKYLVSSVPSNINPSSGDATVSITVDTVSSASPYIFNCSLRSVFGMCGLHADGKNATGFQSMVVAQFTGIGLQKDDNAFVRYNKEQGIYIESELNAHTNSLSRFNPEYENYHIKASNNAFLQLVSVFAIGFANHFLAESGGDHSITNSNSNFGAKSLVAKGFRDEAFIRDDCGYITHVVTPKEIDTQEKSIEYIALDVELTVNKNFSDRLYFYDQDDITNPPEHIVEGFRIGASKSSKLYLQVTDPTTGVVEVVSSEIVMGDTATASAIGPIYNVSGEKRYRVGRSAVGINTIVNNIITMDEEHSFIQGESVLIVANNQTLPDGIEAGKLYYTNVISSKTLRLSRSSSGAINDTEDVVLNNKGGILDIVSRVTDKFPGDPGSPLKYDGEVDPTSGKIRGWYILCNPFQNSIFSKLVNFYNANKIGKVSSRTFIKRKTDNRSNLDKIYKFRYVLPKDTFSEDSALSCRPPIDGYILQDSSNTSIKDSTELSKYFSTGTQVLVNSSELRNPRFIANASWASNIVTIKTEIPHNLTIGSLVEIYNVVSTNNQLGADNKGYNGEYTVLDVLDSLTFTYILSTDPGTFGNSINVRTPESLPRYSQKRLNTTYQIFRSDEIQPYEKGKQDGIYHLSVINSSNFPSVSPFNELSFSQPIQNLYPQLNKDNPNSDPESSHCFALPDPIGQVSINDPQRSITKETLEKCFYDLGFSFKITNIIPKTGTSHSIFTLKDHGLNGITEVAVTKTGDNFVDGTYYNVPLESVSGKQSITGKNATAIVKVVNSQIQSPITIINPGSAYGIGNTLTIKRAVSGEVLGIATESDWVPSNFAYCTVSGINDSVGKVINVSGISSHSKRLDEYNGNYIITQVNSGESNIIQVESEKTITNLTSSGSASQDANAIITGSVLNVNSLVYSSTTGIATVGFTTSHPFKVGSSIRLYGATSSFYNNKNFFVTKILSSVSVRVDMGESTSTPASGGTIKAFSSGYTSNRGDIDKNSEFTSARLIHKYDNFTDILSVQLNSSDLDTTPLQLINATNKGLNLGDYLLIDDEIVRISSRVTSNQVKIIRAVLGTKRQTHKIGSVVQRIKVFPVEFRRNSIIRASGHTFEYLGFGPGNYSTALPERQDRILSAQEEILSQATKIDGGTILYSGMNSDGDFYNNNRKLTSTGKDQIFDAPIPTITGEEPQELSSDGGFNLINPQEAVISRSLKVEGGPELNLVSEFNGPVIFNEKIKSNSEFGLEVQKIKLRGDLEISREITVSESTPTGAANIGDQVINGSPKKNANIGWVYTDQNKWEKYGWINDKLYGVEVTTGNIQNANLVQKLKFQTSTLAISEVFDSATGITTIGLEQSIQAGNKIGIITGTSTDITNSILDSGGSPIPVIAPLPATGISNEYQKQLIKFVGSPLGFGFDIKVDYGSILDNSGTPVGLATITFETPIRPINLGANLGKAAPSIATTSTGTRIIYDNTFSSGSNTNFAVGREGNVLWWSVANSSNSFGYRWYAGTSGISTWTSQGGTFLFDFTGIIRTNGTIQGSILKSTVDTSSGLSPLDIQSSVQVPNLNASKLQDYTASVSNLPSTIVVRNSATSPIISGVCTGLTDSTGTGRPGSYYEDIIGRLTYTPFNKTAGDTVTGLSIFQVIADVWSNAPAPVSGEIEANFLNGPILKVTGTLADNLTLDIGSVPLAANRAFNYTLIVDNNTSSSTGLPISLKVNNTPVTLYWLNNNPPLASGNSGQTVHVIGYTIFSSSSTTIDRVIAVYGSYPSA